MARWMHKLVIVLSLCGVLQNARPNEPLCCSYTITPKRNCDAPYTGPILGSLNESAFDTAPIEATADQTHLIQVGESVLLGNAHVKKFTREIESPHLTYKRPEEIITAQNGFRYQEPGFIMVGEKAALELQTRDLTAAQIEYRVEQKHARGMAETLHRDRTKNMTLNQATYTTCAPGNTDWLLGAKQVFLNPTTGWGEAFSAHLSTFGVPIAYLPYYRFPIDSRRHTGFLTSSVGHSRESGSEVILPFYWNLDPQYDLFLTPRYLSRRGMQLKSFFRYLNRRGKGQIQAEILPQDKAFQPAKSRAFLHYNNQTQWSDHWTFDWILNYVSDKTYFVDLDNDLGLKDLTHLPQEGNLYYNDDSIHFSVKTQGFQTIDETIPKPNRPFARLPEIAFYIGRPESFGLDWNLNTALTSFRREDKALRVDVAPTVRFPLEAVYGRIGPTLTLKTTHYQLDQNLQNSEKHINRTIPIFSLDNQLFLERDLTFLKKPIIQTLEPRIFYVLIPERAQDDIPNFDSSVPNLSFAQLFRENRFTGHDRIGDTNQLSFGLTSRLLEKPGFTQTASASIGQALYFSDRKVRLNAAEDNTKSFSNLLGEFSYQLNQWTLTDTLEWDNTEKQRLERNQLTLQFKKGNWRLFNIGYHFNSPVQQQIDVGLIWPVTSKWLGIVRQYYDLNEKQTIDTFAGFEYNSCCWALRFVVDRKLQQQNNPDQTLFDHRLYLQLELKGLGNIGQKAESLFVKYIPGYQSPPRSEFRYGYE